MEPILPSAVSGAGAAGVSDDHRRVILKVTVEVAADRSDTILVRDGDSPRHLARQFCERHGLQTNLVTPLAAHICENAKQNAVAISSSSGQGVLESRQPDTQGPTQAYAQGRSNSVEPHRRVATQAPMHGGSPNRSNSVGPHVRGGTEAVTPVEPVVVSRHAWRADLAFGLGPELGMSPLARRLDIGQFASISQAVEALNAGSLNCPDGMCAVYSEMHLQYFLVVRADKQEMGARVARDTFGIGIDHGPRPGSGRYSNERIIANAGLDAGMVRAASVPPPPQVSTPGRGTAPRARTPRQQRQHRHPANSVDDRFTWLHQDAVQKRCRMERLRQQVQRDIDDQQARNAERQVAPGTMRCASWHRCPDDFNGLGDRLYRDAAQRELKIKHLQAQQAEQQRHDDEQEATFHPTIEASQRRCHGVGRSMRDPDGRKTKTKIERLREIKDRTEMNACSFKPEIDPRSEALMSQRIARMKISGNLYDALYEDAIRRKERQFGASRALPAGVTFQPDIGVDHYRPPNDDTKEDFVNRLAYSKTFSQRWRESAREQQDDPTQMMQHKSHEQGCSLDSKSQYDFHPQTGRGPLVERNQRQLPIGEYLYETAREKALQSQALHEEEEKSQPSTPRVGATSRQLFEETKRRKYRDLYDTLTAEDSEQKLRASTLRLDDLDVELTEFLKPMVAYLRETGSILEFDNFCASLDYQRQHSAAPTAHIFVQKNSLRTSAKYRRERDAEGFIPQTDRNSNRIAARHRPRTAPLHELLHREKDARDSKLNEQRLQQEEQQLLECTFQPNMSNTRPRSMGAGERSRRSPTRESGSGTPLDGEWSRTTAAASSPAREPTAFAEPICRQMYSEPTAFGSARPAAARDFSMESPAQQRPAAASYGTPRGPRQKQGGPPQALISQLATTHVVGRGGNNMGIGMTSTAPWAETDFVDCAMIGSSENFGFGGCRKQIDQAEQAVARCKTAVAMAKNTVMSVSLA